MKILGAYKNGNINVVILEDGTKIRTTNDDEFRPAFAENCDVTITKKCDGGCEWCYAGCTAAGKHADLMSYKFFNTLHPFTELAINGNDLSHPQLSQFLIEMRKRNVIVNMTVNQKHFMSHYRFLESLVNEKLIRGLGVSLVDPTDEFIRCVKMFDNAVIHVINGIVTMDQLQKLANHDLKILILGYKRKDRGLTWAKKHNDDIDQKWKQLFDALPVLKNSFKVISFDNLAINQLNVKRIIPIEDWDEFYMGNDGTFTFAINLVNGVFSRNSMEEQCYPIKDNIDDMFKVIQNER